jgi:sugar lactone lactonase YvrE
MADISIPNLKFPEGPRWHDGTLWLSDQLGGRIWRVDDQGAATSFYELDHPSGLGFHQTAASWSPAWTRCA